MKHSEQIDQFASAFVLATGNMGDVIKTSTNPHFGSKYAGLPSVVEAIVPALQAQGIACIQSGSNSVETLMIHAASGQWVCTQYDLPAGADAQKTCSANTYARRYALLAAVCAAAEDDDGNNAVSKPKAQQKPAQQDGPAKPSLSERAVKLGLLPSADRVMFVDLCRAKIPGCKDMSKVTADYAAIIDKWLTRKEAEDH
jgi:hypothetical protein